MAKKPADSPASLPSHASVEPDQLSSVLDALGALRPRHQVRVYRISEGGHAQAVLNGRFTADKCDEFIIAERYGGGEYRADVIDPSGRILRQVRVYVPAEMEPAYSPPASDPPRDGLGEFKSSLLSEVRELIRTALPAAPAPAANGLDLNGVAALISALRMGQDGLKPADLVTLLTSQQRAPMSELIAGLRELQALASPSDDGGADDEPETAAAAPLTVEESLMRELVALGRDLVSRMGEKRRPTPPPTKRVPNQAAAPTPPAPGASNAPKQRTAIDKLALMLAANAAAEIDVETTAHAVMEFITRNAAELATKLSTAGDRSLADQIVELVPGLKLHAEYIARVEEAGQRMAAGESQDDDDQDDQDTTGADAGSTQGDAS